MSNVYDLAEKFLKAAGDESEGQIKLAGRLNKKMISKKLEKDRADYNALRMAVDSREGTVRELNRELEKLRKKMNLSRTEMMRAYDVLKNMDLTNTNEVRMNGEDVGYVKDKRVYRLETSPEGELNLVPFRRKKVDEEEMESEEDSDELDDSEEKEDEMSAEDMFASLMR
jgi:hypothetical protein